MSELGDLRRELSHLLDNTEEVQHAVGLFGKETALDAVQRDLGGDRSFSGFGRKVPLGAGYDLGTPVMLNLRPAGLWFLAEDGRKRRGVIRPKKRGGKKAVMTPKGPAASAPYGRSRGLNTLTDTEKAIDKGIERAAYEGVDSMIKKAGF